MKELSECVAVLGDLVASRRTARPHVHAALLASIDYVNASVPHLHREAITFVEDLARQPGYGGTRTAIRDQRTNALPPTDALVRLVDAHVSGLRDGARRSLIKMMAGMDNAEVARTEGISESANSQRVRNNELRVLAEAVAALHMLP